LTLRNEGEDAYKPAEYGNKITIERRISKDGQSMYKLLNERSNTPLYYSEPQLSFGIKIKLLGQKRELFYFQKKTHLNFQKNVQYGLKHDRLNKRQDFIA
jgi:hypothetical protein